MHRGIVLQFAKAPEAGRVKTRMGPHLSPDQSCQLHTALLTHCAKNIAAWVANQGAWRHLLAITQPEHPHWQAQSQEALWVQPQGNLGERMAAAVDWAFAQPGVGQVILVGSDCPAIDGAYLNLAAKALAGAAPLVLGPATDGGYVLIGMSQAVPVFEGIDWGTDKVLAQTLARLEALGLAGHCLAPLGDIDRPEDLYLLENWPDLSEWSQFGR